MVSSNSHLVLVNCVGKKQDGKHQARELYVSDWFKKAKELVELTNVEWKILTDYQRNGKIIYDVLSPLEEIEDYEAEKKFSDEWAQRVWKKIAPEKERKITYLLFRPTKYYLEKNKPSSIHTYDPFIGLGRGIGPQKSWLKNQIQEVSQMANFEKNAYWCNLHRQS